MDLILHNIRISLEDDDPSSYKELAIKKLNLAADHIKGIRVAKKSLDARNKKQFYYNLSLVVTVPDKYKNKWRFPTLKPKPEIKETVKTMKDRPIIVGFGPAGIFAALTFLKYGIKPIIFERGKKVDQRMKDIKSFEKDGVLNAESNIQFGEGGAGTYSDGKLTTRIKETGYVAEVLKRLVEFGAKPEIEYINKPHLGTDQLCKIVKNIREFILESGGEINFKSKVTNLIIKRGMIIGVEVDGKQEAFSSTVILATGHSARDTFNMLHGNGVALEQKPFAVGVRIEHPTETINLMQYGEKYKDNKKLGPADYAFAHDGAFSFCVCPGGEIINASSEEGSLTLNGMSNSLRNRPFTNSAIVAQVKPADFGSADPLAGIEFQRMIEKKAFLPNWSAPAQNLIDFLSSEKSSKIIPNSFRMETISTELSEILPDFVFNRILSAFKQWESRFPMFVSKEAVLIAPESRTSSPVRIVRNEKRQSTTILNFYPVGEGSGYAGGITSSAVDAIKTVETILI